MDTDRIVRESKMIMIAALLVGIALLAIGLVSGILGLGLTPNDKAVTGLSFIPLGVAFVYYLKITMITRSPQQMRQAIVMESDERLVSLNNKADALTLKIVSGVLFLAYMGYTLILPEDVFEAVGWWILLGVLLVTFLSQAGLRAVFKVKDQTKDDEGS